MHLIKLTVSSRGRVPRFHDALLAKAFDLLVRAHRLAVHAGAAPLDFAVEIGEFRRAGVSTAELRWLVAQGYARHAEELAPAGAQRQFQLASPLVLSNRSCFVLADAGLALAPSPDVAPGKSTSRLPAQAPTGAGRRQNIDSHAASGDSPVWEACRSELHVDSFLVKRFRCPAPNQQAVLAAFQQANWPTRIDDPLPAAEEQCPKRRLHDAIKCLNRCQIHAMLRFYGDGSGRGVLWDRVG